MEKHALLGTGRIQSPIEMHPRRPLPGEKNPALTSSTVPKVWTDPSKSYDLEEQGSIGASPGKLAPRAGVGEGAAGDWAVAEQFFLLSLLSRLSPFSFS